MNTYSDEQLIKQYLDKNSEQALEGLVQRYLPLIYSFTKKYVGNQEIASDITQETFVKAWKNLKSFDSSKNFRTWIFTIAKRTAIDWLRQNNALPFSLIDAKDNKSFAESLSDESPSILDQVFSQQQSRQLATAVAKLPANYRSVVRLHHDDGLKFREISAKLKEPLNTIKSRYRRSLALLKKLL